MYLLLVGRGGGARVLHGILAHTKNEMRLKMGPKLIADDIAHDSSMPSVSRVGISGTTAKSRQRKFVPSSNPGHFALVALSHKSQTKVGTLACFDFL